MEAWCPADVNDMCQPLSPLSQDIKIVVSYIFGSSSVNDEDFRQSLSRVVTGLRKEWIQIVSSVTTSKTRGLAGKTIQIEVKVPSGTYVSDNLALGLDTKLKDAASNPDLQANFGVQSATVDSSNAGTVVGASPSGGGGASPSAVSTAAGIGTGIIVLIIVLVLLCVCGSIAVAVFLILRMRKGNTNTVQEEKPMEQSQAPQGGGGGWAEQSGGGI
jgi:hypothetical protein